MKKLLALSTITVSLFASNAILGVKVDQSLSDIKANSSLWMAADFQKIELYPQTAVFMSDENAHKKNIIAVSKEALVGVLYNDKEIAFKLIWPDNTKDIQLANSTDSFADGFAVQLPQEIKNASSIPYIGMGDDNNPVVVYLNKAVQSIAKSPEGDNKDRLASLSLNLYGQELTDFEQQAKSKVMTSAYSKAFVAKGFGSTTEIRDDEYKFSTDMKYDNDRWNGVVVKNIKDSYSNQDANGAFLVAFAAWDGKRDNRDGMKLLSSWQPVTLPDKKDSINLNAINQPVEGDIEKGREVAIANCASCHWFQGAETAPAYMAPGLYNIGGYATTEYIKDSILKPNKVIVPGYNANAHSAFLWYTEADGVKTSTMPGYDWLDKESLNNLMAYLKTLKQEAKR
ncbi:MAG: ethylbenzene dehydrogenase-related protein [Campylobacterales bacterium]